MAGDDLPRFPKPDFASKPTKRQERDRRQEVRREEDAESQRFITRQREEEELARQREEALEASQTALESEASNDQAQASDNASPVQPPPMTVERPIGTIPAGILRRATFLEPETIQTPPPPAPRPLMRIFIEYHGWAQKLVLYVDPEWTMWQIKEMIMEERQIREEQQTLRVYRDDGTLRDPPDNF